MFAVIRTGGKQYRVEPETELYVEKLDAEEGSTIELTDVLMVSGDSGLQVGSPVVDGACVLATVVKHGKGPKIRGFLYKAKKHTQRHWGHRQWYTKLCVTEIKA